MIVGVGFFIEPVLAEVTWQSQRHSSIDYFGFDLPPSEEWEGETDVVRYVPPRYSGSNVSFTLRGGIEDAIWGIAPPIVRKRPPIELTSFTPTHRTDDFSKVAEAVDDVGTATKRSGTQASGVELASFAQIVNERGTLLAHAEGFANQNYVADDFSVLADGKVWSNSEIHASLQAKESQANAKTEAQLSAEFHLTQSFDFILSVDLSTDELDTGLSFLLKDLAEGGTKNVLDLHATTGQHRTLEYCGTLSPGTYQLVLDARSEATANTTQAPDLGGYGEYELYFRALNPHGEIVPLLHPSERRIPGVRYSDEISLITQGATSIASVPEPTLSCLLLSCWFAITLQYLIRHQSR